MTCFLTTLGFQTNMLHIFNKFIYISYRVYLLHTSETMVPRQNQTPSINAIEIQEDETRYKVQTNQVILFHSTHNTIIHSPSLHRDKKTDKGPTQKVSLRSEDGTAALHTV